MQHRSKSTVVVAVLLVYGIYSTLLGVVMLVAPGFFFDTVGGFGPRNPHYIFDTGAFELPLGLFYLAAIRWPGWRVPVLAFATLHYVLHAISHLIDFGNANTHWVGVFDFVVIAIGTVIHAVALWLAIQLRRSACAHASAGTHGVGPRIGDVSCPAGTPGSRPAPSRR